MHEYDYEFWKEIDKAAWKGLKRCARIVFYTLIGTVITLCLQPIRLVSYVLYRWDNREEAVIERESQERFENMKLNGHI